MKRFMRPSRVSAHLVGLLLIASAHWTAAQSPAPSDSSAAAAVPDPDSIVARAIARRGDVFAALGPVRYEAFVKVVARDLGARRDPARTVLFVSETHSTAYWAPRRRYQETIEARRQSRGFGAPRGLVAVDEIVDLGRSSVLLGCYTGSGRGWTERRGGGGGGAGRDGAARR